MKDSSKSFWSRSSRRAPQRRTHARRLGIEAMEDRVLLSGTSMDTLTFDAGLAPVVVTQNYYVDAPNDQGMVLTEGAIKNLTLSSSMATDGGFANASANVAPPIVGSGSRDIWESSPTSTYDPGIILNTNGAGDSIGNVNHVQPRGTPGTTQAVTFSDQIDGDVDAAWRPIRISTEPASVITQSHRIGASVSEGGPIQVASLARLPAGGDGESGNIVAKLARDEVDRDLLSSRLADGSAIAAGQIEGEWARAVAMEAVSASRASSSPADSNSNDSPSGRTHGSDGSVPLSATHDSAHKNSEGDVETAEGVKAVESIANPAGYESRATTAAYERASGAIDVSALSATSHRLERSSRVARGANVERTESGNLVRDAVFSEWHDGDLTDAAARNIGVSEHRMWVNPGPFLAVLALERFVRVEPKQKQSARSSQLLRGEPAR